VLRALAGVALALFGVGCRSLAPAPEPLDAKDARWHAAVLAWNERARERVALRGTATLAVDSAESGLHLRSRQRFALERPNRLRVEVLGFLDQSLALLCIDGAHYELFRAEGRQVERGALHDRLLRDQAQLDLRAADAIELLLGAPLLDPTLAVARAWSLPARGLRVALVDDRGALREEAEFDAEGELTQLRVFSERGELERSVRFGDRRAIGRARLAHQLAIEWAAPASRAELVLRDLDPEPELADDAFRLPASLAARTRR
jgi:hypothetical protein